MSYEKSFIFGKFLIAMMVIMFILMIGLAISRSYEYKKIIGINEIKEYTLEDAEYNLFAKGNGNFKNTDFRISKTPPEKLRFVNKENGTEIVYVLQN